MKTLTVSLRDAGSLPREIVGGKARALGQLMAEGFNVPDGYVITTAAFEQFASDEVLPAELLAPVNGSSWAFRSSALREDGASASFAGQYVSVLGVQGPDAAHEALKACWRSVHSRALDEYAEAVGTADSGLAVIVQQMVDARCAGVAFTRNPITGADEVVIEATVGLGDALLEGNVDPERWTVARDGSSQRQADLGVLTDERVAEIAQICREIERVQGGPQDIEWAWASDKVYVLQARPITALPVEPTLRPPPNQTWQRVDSHFPRPVLPLAVSMWLPMHGRCFTRVCAETGMPFDTIRSKVFGGRVYSRVELAGDRGQGRDDRPPPPRPIFWLLLRLVPDMRRRMRIARRAADSDLPMRLIVEWEREGRERIQNRTQRLREVDRPALDDSTLADHIDDVLEHAEETGYAHFSLSCISGMSTLGALGKRIQRELGWSTTEIVDLVQGYSSVSTELGDALDDLAETIASDDDATHLLHEDAAALRQHDSAAGEALRGFIDRYGHRTFDASVDQPMWAEDPRPLFALLRARLVGRAERIDPMARSRAAAERLRAEVGSAEWPRFERLLSRARRARPYQDETEALCYDMFGLLRYASMEAARRLVRRGELRTASHVWFLEIDELLAALRGAPVDASVLQRRRGEHRWAQGNELPATLGPAPHPPPDLPLPSSVEEFLGGAFWAFAAMESGDSSPPPDANMVGHACSPGVFTGPVRVVESVVDLHELQTGEVLVCKGTSAAWSFAFPLVGGLITEIGGPLSHPGTLAREYGIPAVLGVTDATKKLKTGDIVTLDGAAGAIWTRAN